MSDRHAAIEALGHLDLRFSPSERVRGAARVTDYDAWYASWRSDPDAFWAAAASELDWFEPWCAVSEIELPDHRWFVGGRTNLSHNCFERNIDRGLGDKTCLVAECEQGPTRTFSYAEALGEVSRIAGGLAELGVGRGDRVVLYMPLGPEGIFTMQACARLGAVHSVVYAGMGPSALAQRISDCEAVCVVAADLTYRRGKTVALKPIVDQALASVDCVRHVVVHRRDPATVLADGQLDFADLVAGRPDHRPAEHMDAEDPAFILYTSGTTGRPKGVVHVHGGYMVGVHLLMKNYFDTGADDVWWSTSDIGWIVGHSYICYGPMLVGATQVIREGAPDYPDAGVVWRLVERHRVTNLFSAPTAVRMFMRAGEDALAGRDLSSLRVFYCAGEPFNPEAWQWAQQHLCRDGGQVVDNYWQTEIASPMLGTFPAMDARPGFAGKPMPGVELEVVDEHGEALSPGEGGLLVMKRPLPYMMRTVFGDRERYESVWSERLGGYVTGDIAVRDDEGYWAVLGRSDDVLNVAGHRIGTADVESSLIEHDAVVEAAAIGLPDELKGERIKVFVTVAATAVEGDELVAALKRHVRETLGPIAQPSEVSFVASLPKTRSGKIMRRLLRARELGLDEGDTSTLED